MSTPRTRPAPVMNQTFFSLIVMLFLCLLLGWDQDSAPTTQPHSPARWEALLKDVPTEPPNSPTRDSEAEGEAVIGLAPAEFLDESAGGGLGVDHSQFGAGHLGQVVEFLGADRGA